MTREEYISRTNHNVSEEDFEFIHRIYMAAGDNVDKDQFCEDFKAMGVNLTICSLTEAVETRDDRIARLTTQMNRLAVFIAEQAEETSSSALRDRAIQMMGKREYITWKIEAGKRLWLLDLELIKELINQ